MLLEVDENIWMERAPIEPADEVCDFSLIFVIDRSRYR